MSGRLFAFVFVPLVVLLSVVNREALFVAPQYEEGDMAANALQIDRAKRFEALHGNYSRFSFRHPGPAFFYAYAVGEGLLHDVLRVSPAPYNAHLLTGMLVQLAFFSAAIAIASRRTPQPMLAAASMVFLAALHFGGEWGVVFSVWPPHVLLMPFLCLLVAAAAVSLGEDSALVPLVVAGCFLIHGHVAQPLFVIPLTALAIGWLIRGRRSAGQPMMSRRDAPACAIALLFAAPIVVDAFAGRESNLYHIRLHLAYASDATQTWWQSLLCFVSYFLYVDTQEAFNTLTPESFADFRARWPLPLLWAGLIAAATVVAWRQRNESPVARYTLRLLALFGVASLLSVYWGTRQDGGFTSFNSFFVLALSFSAVVAAVTLASARTFRGIRWPAALGAGLVGAAAFATTIRMPADDNIRAKEIAANLPAILRADPLADAPKLLDFAPGHWYEAVTLARALRRNGMAFYANPSWRILFGDEFSFRNQHEALTQNRLSRWRVEPADSPGPGAALTSALRVAFPQPAPLPPFPAAIDFSGTGNFPRYHYYGVCPPDPSFDWTWTEAEIAAIEFTAAPVAQPVEIAIEIANVHLRWKVDRQPLIVWLNGEKLGRVDVAAPGTVTFRATAATWNRQSPLRLALELPGAAPPSSFVRSPDRRLLALGLRRIEFRPGRAEGN